MMRRAPKWAFLLGLGALVLVQAVALRQRMEPPVSEVFLVAPPLTIWDAQGEIWLVAPSPAPFQPFGGRPESPADATRQEIVRLAGEMLDGLSLAQREEMLSHRVEASRAWGELSVWESLGAR